MDPQTPTSSMDMKKSLCFLEQIEAEVLLNIATQIPDLLSLHNLIHASPATFRLFEVYGVYITECVCANDRMPGQVLEMFHTVAYIRSGTIPMATLDDFVKEVLLGSRLRPRPFETYEDLVASCRKGEIVNPLMVKVFEKYRKGPPKIKPFILPSLPKGISPRILRSVLAVVWQISRLTPACLQHYLSRLMSMRSQHLVDKTLRYPRGSKPRESSYEIEDFSPPSWVEQQRVVCAFWRIRALYDLKTAGERGLLEWSKDDLERLRRIDYSQIFDRHRVGPFGDQEIETVLDYLHDLRGYKRITNPDDMDFPTNPPHLDVNLGWPVPLRCSHHERELSSLAKGVLTFNGLFTDQNSTLYQTPFTPFRRLGFALWDEERIRAIGLGVLFENPYIDHGVCPTPVWDSIISVENKRFV